MKTRVQKWGHGLALHIPESFAAEAGLQEDASVELSVVEGKLIVQPVALQPPTLEELLRGVTEENLPSEWDTGQLALVMRAEISYDLVMDDDMPFVEGTYRLAGGDWQVVIVSRCDVDDPQIVPQRWESGVAGIFVQFPRAGRLNRATVERMLSAVLGVSEWVEVRGPDSMQLR